MMTREEIDRHVAGILRLRKHNNRSRAAKNRYDRGFDTGADFETMRKRGALVNRAVVVGQAETGAVDDVFRIRQRAGWLPRSGGRD